jgi:hypothetical protein
MVQLHPPVLLYLLADSHQIKALIRIVTLDGKIGQLIMFKKTLIIGWRDFLPFDCAYHFGDYKI